MSPAGGPLVACIGDALVDLLARVSGLPRRGGASWSPPPIRAAGGTGANVASGLARLGVNVAFFGRIGEDVDGEFLARDLASSGVDVSHLGRDSEAATGVAFAMIESDGERTFVACAQGAAHTRLTEGDLDAIEDLEPAAIFVTGVLLLEEPSRTAVLQMADRVRGRLPLYFDPNLRQPGSETDGTVREALHAVARVSDVVLAGEEEVRSLSLKPLPEQLYTVKCGGEGARLERGDFVVAYATGHEVEVVDTTGAGDAFNAAFIAARVKGYDDSDALSLANAAAALSVTKPGARTMPSWDEATELWRQGGGST